MLFLRHSINKIIKFLVKEEIFVVVDAINAASKQDFAPLLLDDNLIQTGDIKETDVFI